MKKLTVLLALMLLPACVSQWDLQGHDPKDYYAKHPKINKVETREFTRDVMFAPGAVRLDADERDALRTALRDVSPDATQGLLVQLPPSQDSAPKREYMRKLLRSMGYAQGELRYASNDDVQRDMARVTITYAVVVLPDCPDWRLSPVTTYSNTSQANFGCASTVNLGLQVADPRDLVRGKDWGGPNAARNSLVMQDYHSGKEIGKPVKTGGAVNAEPGAPSGGE